MSSAEEAKAALSPIFDEYVKHLVEQDFEKAAEHLDPNFVYVHAGEKAIYGKEALKKHFEEVIEQYGKATPKLTPEEFHMAGDFIIVTGHFEADTEKKGVVKGHFTHIWRKHGDTYLLLHDEGTHE